MSRRPYDEYERDMRDMRDRRGREPREMQREQDPRERPDRREHRRTEGQDPDRMDYTRDGRSDLRTTRESITRPIYPYADQNDRDDPPSRGYPDDSQDRHRPPIELQPERREEPAARYQDYFLPGEGINREVIQFDICRYLGNDATVRPYTHPDGRQGFVIKAYRAPTTAMITTLKQDSKRFENEAAQRRRQFGQPGIPYASSTTFDDRQRAGRPDVPQPGYTGYGMDTDMDGYDDDRAAGRGYRDPEPPRMDRQDQRQQPPIGRHGQMPPVYQTYPQGDPSYPPSSYQVQPVSSGSYDQTSSLPRTLGPNNTPPPTMGRGGQAIYAGGYPVVSSAGYSIPTSAAAASGTRYAETANGRVMVNYAGGVPYAPERHATARR